MAGLVLCRCSVRSRRALAARTCLHSDTLSWDCWVSRLDRRIDSASGRLSWRSLRTGLLVGVHRSPRSSGCCVGDGSRHPSFSILDTPRPSLQDKRRRGVRHTGTKPEAVVAKSQRGLLPSSLMASSHFRTGNPPLHSHSD